MITKVKPGDILGECRQVLGLKEDPHAPVDNVLLAALARRAAGIHCPCSRSTLRASLLECLQFLVPDEGLPSEHVDSVIEDLIVSGDLLELNDVAADDPDAKGTWVFAASPGFVLRPSGDIFLFGIVPDQDVFLPGHLGLRVRHEGFTRVITPKENEDLVAQLSEQGLRSFSEAEWLKKPEKEVPEKMLSRFEQKLRSQPPSGDIEDLKILDPEKPVNYYNGRWIAPRDHTGQFVARRPREFGAQIWCFVEMEAAGVSRLLDLPAGKSRWRGCDEAWRLQMAIDRCRGEPQLYRRRPDAKGVRLDFFSPLPKWSQRRLEIFGSPLSRQKSLMSYLLPHSEAETEERFLKEYLWLSPSPDSDMG